ncbi:hypothetical protein KKA53_04955 [Candidatus Dependentiae bacterium]|nr:hypothetical protein [Candidatus Dependentiae bacterium]
MFISAGWIVAAMIISAMATAYGVYAQGQAQKKAGQAQAAALQNQAEWAEYEKKQEAAMLKEQAEYYELNAILAEKEAGRKEASEKKTKERVLSAQRARYGKAGVVLSQGSPLEVALETSKEAERVIDSILYEGALEAWNWRMKGKTATSQATAAEISGASSSSAYRAQAAINTMKGKQAATAGTYKAGTTILTGATKATGYAYEKGLLN